MFLRSNSMWMISAYTLNCINISWRTLCTQHATLWDLIRESVEAMNGMAHRRFGEVMIYSSEPNVHKFFCSSFPSLCHPPLAAFSLLHTVRKVYIHKIPQRPNKAMYVNIGTCCRSSRAAVLLAIEWIANGDHLCDALGGHRNIYIFIFRCL